MPAQESTHNRLKSISSDQQQQQQQKHVGERILEVKKNINKYSYNY